MNNNYESHAISRRSFLKASGVVGAAGILAACGGNVKDVQTKAVASEMYTQNDIDAAIDVIKKDFSRSWKGCGHWWRMTTPTPV